MKKTFKINHYYNIKHCLKATNIHVLVFFYYGPHQKNPNSPHYKSFGITNDILVKFEFVLFKIIFYIFLNYFNV